MSGVRLWRKVELQDEPPYSRNKHTAVVVGNELVLFGGYSLQQRQFFNDVTVFDLEALKWRELEVHGQPPSKRRAHSCIVTDKNQLLVFGGYNGDFCLNDTYTFDMATHQWARVQCTGDLPAHRGGHTAVWWGPGRMVVHGGWDVGNVYFDCTYILHTDEWRWERLQVTGAYRPVGRVGHTAVLDPTGQLYVFGGYGNDGYWDDLNCLDLATRRWSVVEVRGPLRPCQRTFSTMEIVGDRILLFGGSNHDVEMNDVMMFHTGSRTWEVVDCPGDVPEGRFAHTSCLYNHKVYLYGGIVRGSGELNGIYELTLEKFTADTSLRALLKAWIVNSGLPYHAHTAHLPLPLAKDLKAYDDELTEMRALEHEAECQRAVELLLPLEKPASLCDEDSDGYEALAHLAEEEYCDFDCDSNPEIWDVGVDDIVQHLLSGGLGPVPSALLGSPPRPATPVPHDPSSSSSSSSNALGLSPGPFSPPPGDGYHSSSELYLSPSESAIYGQPLFFDDAEELSTSVDEPWMPPALSHYPELFFSHQLLGADPSRDELPSQGYLDPACPGLPPPFCAAGSRPGEEQPGEDEAPHSPSLGIDAGPGRGCPATPAPASDAAYPAPSPSFYAP